MTKPRSRLLQLCIWTLFVALVSASCSKSRDELYFGKVTLPDQNVLHYVSGSEPESLDPQIGTGQAEARIYMALFEGLTEYHPKTMEPIPGIAERWEVNNDSSEFVFHLRRNARWSNGEAITARDFVYTFRRGFSPRLGSRSAYLGYYIKYAQEYNRGGLFVRDPATGEYLLAKDFEKGKTESPSTMDGSPSPSLSSPNTTSEQPRDTEFHRFINSPDRVVLPGAEKSRDKVLAANPNLKAALAGKELVPVKAEDIGVEAVDDYTVRVTLKQSVPFFVDLMSHPFFRAVPQKTIEQYEESWGWSQPGQPIVGSGPFKVESWKPYDELVVVKNEMYWDAERVRLDRIYFYPADQNSSILSMYQVGQIDAMLNHSVPAAWLDVVRPLKDYMDAPECGVDYYLINVTKYPMTDVRVRRAFNMAIDKVAYARWRQVVKPLTAFTPEGIFQGYPQPKGDEFNPQKARSLLAEAGFKDSNGNFDPAKFPIDLVSIVYNTHESNKAVAEFIQAQWSQNLGLTVPLRNMEMKTFLSMRARLEYSGFARGGWGGDYMDPFTFLSLFYAPANDNGTGWSDDNYLKMLDDANLQLDKTKRYELLAKAEAFLIEAQPMIPLATPGTNWLKKPYVKGMYPTPLTLHPWKFVYIERDPAKWDNGVLDLRKRPGEFGPQY
jgi:oligopeptide transport system substrate-binding protein